MSYEHEKEIELAKIQLEREMANFQYQLSMEKSISIATDTFNPGVFEEAGLSTNRPESGFTFYFTE